MAKQLQLRSGTTTEHNTFTGAVGELTYDTTRKQLRVHDGSTVGGLPTTDDYLAFMPIPYPKSTPPSGYLAMMGQAISESTYPKLYALYGANLPDMRAYSIRGLDYGRGIDAGRVVLTQQEDAIAEHKHILLTGRNNDGDYHNQGSARGHVGEGYSPSFNAGDKWIGDVTSASVAFETRIKNIAFLYIVKAG